MEERQRKLPKREGFTLIEAIMYIALLGMLLTGALITSYSLIDGSQKISREIAVSGEADFIQKKIIWALSGVEMIHTPLMGATSTFLSLTKSGLPAVENPLIFSLKATLLELKKGENAGMPLNSEASAVTNLVFTHVSPSDGKPSAIQINFTLQDKHFEIKKYLK